MTEEYAFYRATEPPAPLRRFIQSFWLYDGYRPQHSLERVLPTGTVEIVIPLGGQGLVWRDLAGRAGACRGAVASGPQLTAFDVPTDQQVTLAGVHFHPGGAWPLFGVPMDALVDQHVPMEELCGPSARELTERLSEAPREGDRFALLAAFFLDQLASRSASHGAVRAALHRIQGADGAAPIADLVAASGVSHRRFIDVFKREVGLVPRDFARVRRFHAALDRSQSESRLNGSALANEAGYFDQSHWILECKKLSGLPPRALIAYGRDAVAVLPREERVQMLPIRGVDLGAPSRA